MKIIKSFFICIFYAIIGLAQNSKPSIYILDSSINGINMDYNSIIRVFGKKRINNLNYSNQEFRSFDDDPYAIMLSNDRNQYFRIVKVGDNNCCNYFEIGYSNEQVKKLGVKSKFHSFNSNNNIFLGMNYFEFLKKIEKPFIKYDTLGLTIIKILKNNLWDEDSVDIKKQVDSSNIKKISALRKIYSAKYYYIAEYVFFKNKLVLFGFGSSLIFPSRNKFLPFKH